MFDSEVNMRINPCCWFLSLLLSMAVAVGCKVEGHYISIDASDRDALIDGAPGEWSSPEPLSNVNTVGPERDPGISANGLEIYFMRYSNSAPLGEVYSAVRASTSIPFGTPFPIAGVNTNGNENAVQPAHNGTELFFSRTSEIMIATRASSTAQWGNPTSTGFIAYNYSLSSDDLSLYLVQRCPPGMHNGNGPCLSKAVRPAVGAPFSQPTSLAWPGPLQWNHAHVSGDGLRVLLSNPYSSTAVRAAQSGRASTSEAFGPLEVLNALSLESTNGELSWNSTETEIYLTAKPTIQPVGDYDIYVSVLR